MSPTWKIMLFPVLFGIIIYGYGLSVQYGFIPPPEGELGPHPFTIIGRTSHRVYSKIDENGDTTYYISSGRQVYPTRHGFSTRQQ